MGVCESKTQIETQTQDKIITPNKPTERISEVYNDHIPVPVDIINKASKSICKIIITINEDKSSNFKGTGFFMNASKNKRYLITNYHILSEDRFNYEILIEIHNHKTMKLNKYNRDIKFFPKPKDITIIEIKNEDEIYNDIEFLDFDLNYKEKGYEIYRNVDVFTIGFPLGNEAEFSNGKSLTSRFQFSTV